MRVALVHDWLLGMRGGERCLEVLCQMFPDADVYTAFYKAEKITQPIRSHRVSVSSLGRLPEVSRYYRWLLPFFPFASRSLSRSLRLQHQKAPYDLVISVSHCLAKNISVPPGVPHLCYCLTPVRYFWDHFETYFEGRLVYPVAKLIVSGLRKWDLRGARGVTRFVGISKYIADRIQRVYGEPAGVAYPPVRTDWISTRREVQEGEEESGEGFLCVNALVPYKNVELVIEAFLGLPYHLTVIGEGPEGDRLRSLVNKHRAGEKIQFLAGLSDEELAEKYRKAKALVFAAEEDFGMVPVEMQAAGRPVIAFGRGGALETVEAGKAAPSGLYFSELTTDSIRAAVEDFILRQGEFTLDNCTTKAQQFSLEQFQQDFLEEVRGLGFSRQKLSSISRTISSLLEVERRGENPQSNTQSFSRAAGGH